MSSRCRSTLLATLVLAASPALAGCGGDDDEEPASRPDTGPAETRPAPTETEADPPAASKEPKLTKREREFLDKMPRAKAPERKPAGVPEQTKELQRYARCMRDAARGGGDEVERCRQILEQGTLGKLRRCLAKSDGARDSIRCTKRYGPGR